MANLGELLLQHLHRWGTLLMQWLCRNQQQLDQARREQLVAWRAAVDRDDFERRSFADSNAYATLRGHLPEDLQQEIDRWRNPMMVVMPSRGGRDPRQAQLLQEVARIEREWGFI